MAESELKKKVQKRRGHRLFITNILKSYANFIPKPEETLTEEARLKLESFKRTLIKQQKELGVLDEQIFDLLPEEGVEEEISAKLDFEASIDETICILDSVLGKRQSVPSDNDVSVASSMRETDAFKRQAKLHKLTLPTFDGAVEEWPSFWDIFEAAVDADPHLSDVTKFQYLQAQLKGAAHYAISGLKVTNANYESAVKLLKERFGQKQLIVSKHVSTLVKLQAVESCSDLRHLRILYDKTENIVRSLEGIGIDVDSYGTFLTPVLMGKIPDELRIVITRKLGSVNWDLKQLLNIFKEELLIRESCNLMPSDGNAKSFRRTYSTSAKAQPYTTSALFSQERNQTSLWNDGLCAFCQGTHQSNKCQIVTNPGKRRKILMQAGKCFVCFRSGHIGRDCKSKMECFQCGAKHHVAVCGASKQHRFGASGDRKADEKLPQFQSDGTSIPSQSFSQSTSSLHVEAQNEKVRAVLLQTARGKITSPENNATFVNIRMLLDSGSQKSYLSQRVCQRLNLPVIGKERIQIKTFGNPEPIVQDCEIVQLCLNCPDGLKIYINAFSVPFICSPLTNQNIGFAKQNYPYLRDLSLADFAEGDEELCVDMILGSEYYWTVVVGNPIRGNGPTAILTHLGWVLNGQVDTPIRNQSTSLNLNSTHVMKIETVCRNDDILKTNVEKMWDYETLGIKREEPAVYDKFVKETLFKDGRYEVKLPFKESRGELPDNYSLSEKRLNSLFSKLKNRPDVLSEYHNIIQEQLKTGIIERVNENDDSGANETHYLPHRAVVREDKSTTKLRIVFDASAKVPHETSLNESLYAGPPLTPLIFDMLLRFRTKNTVLIGDIEKAFLNVNVNENDRDYLRFLWIDDIHKTNPEIVTYKFRTICFGLVSSPFLLNATIRTHLKQYAEIDDEFVLNVLESLYVDDYLSSFDSTSDAFKMYLKLKERFKNGGFNLRKWNSNCEELRKAIATQESCCARGGTELKRDAVAEEDETFSKSTIKGYQNQISEKILGLSWNKDDDCFSFNLRKIVENQPETITKRYVLSTIAQLFDPLGLIAHFVLPFKLFFQSLCTKKFGWDTPLIGEMLAEWNLLVKHVCDMEEIKVPRNVTCVDPDDIDSIELHGFCDASNHAYGAAIYLRVLEKNGNIHNSLLTAKTRLAPIKGETIPRLELMGGLMLARLIKTTTEALKNKLKIDAVFCWSDSQIVLWWIFGEKKEFKQFVQNRLIEIRKLVDPRKWHYCPTELNPADVLSRGNTPTCAGKHEFLKKGPRYLHQSTETWPNILNFESKREPNDELIEEMNKHLKSNPRKDFSDVFHNFAISSDNPASIDKIVNCENFSSAAKLFRTTAWVMRFVLNLKLTRLKREIILNELSIDEIDRAKQTWYKNIQSTLKNEKNFQNNSVILKLFVDDNGLLRCDGRIKNANLPYETKFPILLPKRHHITKLLIYEAHDVVKHNGLRETLTEFRASFWLIGGRQIVKSMLSKCVICKRLEGKAYKPPSHAPLPEFRVNARFAFENIGVDFAGPIFVRNIYGSDRTMHKAYIALYTCAVTRAVHVELCPDLSAPAFIRSLKRFQGRRGLPCITVSDNGQTFKDKRVQRFAVNNGIKWKFNVPRASFWGGFFEIMVKLVKRCLKKIIGNSFLSFEELETVLVEIEGVLNSRPLTYVSNDLPEEPLTPSSLINGRRLLNSKSFSGNCLIDSSRKILINRDNHLQLLLNHFWNRWSREYLTNLREFHRNKSTVNKQNVNIGDVVVVKKDKVPRQRWSMGKILRVYEGKDRHIRAVDVKTLDNAGKSIVLKRSIEHLYPLEIQAEVADIADNDSLQKNFASEEPKVQFVSDVGIQMCDAAR